MGRSNTHATVCRGDVALMYEKRDWRSNIVGSCGKETVSLLKFVWLASSWNEAHKHQLVLWGPRDLTKGTGSAPKLTLRSD